MSRPLVTAYAASLARVASWVIVFGIIYRASGAAGQTNLGLLALARATVGLFAYASLGITPVLIRLLTRNPDDPDAARRGYATAFVMVVVAAAIGGGVLATYLVVARQFPNWPASAPATSAVFLTVGLATLLRAASDVFASALLAGGRIIADNLCQIVAEAAFVAATGALVFTIDHAPTAAGLGFLVSAAVLITGRGWLAAATRRVDFRAVDGRMVWPLLLLCSAVLAGQMADWLYAPLNQILIDARLGTEAVAPYAVAIQIDGGLLLLVGGLSSVLLPATAIAVRDGRLADVRRRYVQAWLASLLLLAGASAGVVVVAPLLFEVWLGNAMSEAAAILPWVLVHTAIGGTAGVGRAVLLGIGEFKAYTISALLGGVANALLAIVLLTQTSLGLRGVVIATIITVTVRCGVWMPWYTLRCLRRPIASSI